MLLFFLQLACINRQFFRNTKYSGKHYPNSATTPVEGWNISIPFSFPRLIYCPRITVVLLPSRESDPGSHSRPSAQTYGPIKLLQGDSRMQPQIGFLDMVFDSRSGSDKTSHSKTQKHVCIPKAWVCSPDHAFDICRNQPLSALGERYRDSHETSIKTPYCR